MAVVLMRKQLRDGVGSWNPRTNASELPALRTKGALSAIYPESISVRSRCWVDHTVHICGIAAFREALELANLCLYYARKSVFNGLAMSVADNEGWSKLGVRKVVI